MIKFSEAELIDVINQVKLERKENNIIKASYYKMLSMGASPYEAISEMINFGEFDLEEMIAFIESNKNVKNAIKNDLIERGLLRSAIANSKRII